MSFASMLIDTCTIRRFTAGAQDAYGHPAEPWADHITGEPCRLSVGGGGRLNFAGREVRVGAEVVVADHALFIDDIDITEQDRVIVDSVTYEILLIVVRADHTSNHHKECWLRTLR